MKIEWGTVFQDMDGKDIKIEGDKPMTLAKVAVSALTNVSEQDRQLTGEEKFKLGQLAFKIHTEPEAEFEVEDISKVKDKIGKFWSPYIVFKAYSLLK